MVRIRKVLDLIGDAAVGKTSTIEGYRGEPLQISHKRTVGYNIDNIEDVMVWEFGGQQVFRFMQHDQIQKRAKHANILRILGVMVDAQRRKTLLVADKLIFIDLEVVLSAYDGAMVILNKTDGVKETALGVWEEGTIQIEVDDGELVALATRIQSYFVCEVDIVPNSNYKGQTNKAGIDSAIRRISLHKAQELQYHAESLPEDEQDKKRQLLDLAVAFST